jgi:hypothetical protein
MPWQHHYGCCHGMLLDIFLVKLIIITIKRKIMEDQILELEKKYWSAMEAHDYQAVKNLTRFPCIVAGKDGVRSVDEAAFKKMFDSGAGVQWKALDISGQQVQNLNDHTAIIAYQLTVQKDEDTPMPCVCSSTWVKENENWVCAMHTECALERK